MALHGPRDHAVVLTDRGRDLLESDCRDRDGDHSQAFYAELKKPREVERDAQIYRAYQREAERLHERDARVERLVLDYDPKRESSNSAGEESRPCPQSRPSGS